MEPLVAFPADGKASVIERKLPEPTSYPGDFTILLSCPAEMFNAAAKQAPAAASASGGVSALTDKGKLEALKRLRDSMSPGSRGTDTAKQLEELANSAAGRGMTLSLYKTMGGDVRTRELAPPSGPDPRIVLSYRYALTTFLGRYGAGRVLNTFTLLPGEKTTISIKTYRKSATETAEASSILDSYTESKATEFQDSVQSEQSNKATDDTAEHFYVDADASGDWGVAKASVKAGATLDMKSQREEFAKSVKSSTSKQANTASAKRDVQVNTSSKSSTESGEETATERKLENINVSRTLNFVFRQMNQEFISMLHLVDIRVGFFNGYKESKRIVPLDQLDELLDAWCTPAGKTAIRKMVRDEVRSLKDYAGQPASGFILPVNATDDAPLSVSRVHESGYVDAAHGIDVAVRGVIMDATVNVMRTDGVLVESLLGLGDALDAYSLALQDEKARQQRLDNDRRQVENDLLREELAIVKAGDAAKAAVVKTMKEPAPPPQVP